MSIFNNLNLLQSQVGIKLNPTTQGFIPTVLNPNNLTQLNGILPNIEKNFSNIGGQLTNSFDSVKSFVENPSLSLSNLQGAAELKLNELSKIPENLQSNLTGVLSNMENQFSNFGNNLTSTLSNTLPINASILPKLPQVKVEQLAPPTKNATIVQTIQTNQPKYWIDNPITATEQPSYTWKLYMTDDRDLPENITTTGEAFQILDNKQKVIIAQTGVTGINITKVQFDTVTGPNFTSRNTTGTVFAIDIVEPANTSLMTQLLDTAKTLGIRNYAKCFYYLELKFLGYDEEGLIKNNICSYFPNGGRWIWKIQFTNIDAALNASGGSYTFHAVDYGNIGLQDEFLKIPLSVMATGLTMNEMFSPKYPNSLFSMLNKDVELKYGGKTKEASEEPLYQYDIKFMDTNINGNEIKIGDFVISSSDIEQVDQRSYNFKANDGKITGHFQKNSNITDAINAALVASQTAQLLSKGINESERTAPNGEILNAKIHFKIDTLVKVSDQYDYYNERYKLKITFVVNPVLTWVPTIDPLEKELAEKPLTQQNTLNYISKTNLLRKKYSYLFTGINTEVINLDVRFGFVWNAILPEAAGYRGVLDQTPVGAKVNDTILIRSNKDELQEIQRQISTLEDRIQKLNKETSNTVANFRQLEILQTNLDAFKVQQQDLLTQRDKLRSTYNNTQTNNRVQPKLPFNTLFSEDLVGDNKESLPFPISYRQADLTDTTNGSISTDYTRDNSVFSCILNQLYASSAAQLQTIDMEIIGDPYWLGISGIEKNIFVNNPQYYQSQEPINNLPYYGAQDHMFYLTFRYPQGFGENDNFILRKQEQFNGIYMVSMVTHSFINGSYRQTLKAIRVPLLNPPTDFEKLLPTTSANLINTRGNNSPIANTNTTNALIGTNPTNTPPTQTTLTPKINNTIQTGPANGAVLGDKVNNRPKGVGLKDIDNQVGDMKGLTAQEALSKSAQASVGTTTGIGAGGVPHHPCDWAARNTFAPVLERLPDERSANILAAMGNGGAANQMNAVVNAAGGANYTGSMSAIKNDIKPGQVLYTGTHVLYTAQDAKGQTVVYDGQYGRNTPGRAVQAQSIESFVKKYQNSQTNFKVVQIV